MITIRKHIEEDIPYRVKWLNNMMVSKYLWINTWEETILEKQQEWFRNYRKDPNKKFFTICDCETPIWFMWLSNISSINKNADLFIMIWEPEYHGKWVWKYAMKSLVKFWFEKLKLHKLILQVFEENVPAVKLYESLGFKVEWRLIDDAFFDGSFHNCLCMAIFNKNN